MKNLWNPRLRRATSHERCLSSLHLHKSICFCILCKRHKEKLYVSVPLECECRGSGSVLTHGRSLCSVSCGEISHWAHFLLKQKYKATNKHICKPQHNVHIMFKPSARQQSLRPLYTVFVDCAVCELVPAWTALTHWQRQWTCETSCKMYSGAAGQSFVKVWRCFACWANVWEKNFSDF